MAHIDKATVSYIILIILSTYVFLFSSNTHWIEDDGAYMFVFQDNGTDNPLTDKFISNVNDILESQKNHYITTNGRVVAHTIVQTINPFLSHTLFSALNAFVYAFFVLWLVKLSMSLRCGRRITVKESLHKPLAIAFVAIMTQFSLMLRFTPAYSMYIWMYSLVLVYLDILLYNLPKSGYWAFLLFPFAVIVGNAHESINIGLALGLAIYGIRNIKRLTINEYAMLIGFAAGLMIIVFSPAARSRASAMSNVDGIFISLIYLRASAIMIVLLICGLKTKSILFRNFLSQHSLMIISFLGCLFFCLIIKNNTSRPLYGAETIALILSIVLIGYVKLKKRTVILGMFILLAFSACGSIRYANLMYERDKEYKTVKRLFSESMNGEIFIEFPSGRNPMIRALHILYPYSPSRVHSDDPSENHLAMVVCTKLFNREYGTNKTLKYIIPLSKDIYKYPDINQTIETVPGNFYAIISKSSPPHNVTVHRSALWGLIKWKDYQLYPTLNRPIIETNNLEVYSAYDRMCFVGIDSISLTEQ